MRDIRTFEEKFVGLKGKRVLYIATKNKDYLRLTQEIELVKKYADNVSCILSDKKGYFLRIFEVFIKTLFARCRDYDIVFVGFQPQFIVPFFKWKFKKCELWLDFFISLYDTLVFDRKKFSKGSIPAKIAKFFDQKTLDAGDVIVCDTKAHGRYFVEEFGVNVNKMHVLYLHADETIYYPRKVRKPKKLENKYTVFYFGSILPLQGVEVVLKAADILKSNKNIHFVIVGPIQDKIKKVKSDTITYINWLPQEKLARYIAFSDLCLAGHFSAEIEKADRTIPGKAYIYESMGKKMVLGDSMANHERYDGDNVIFVPRGNAEMLAEVILKNSLENG